MEEAFPIEEIRSFDSGLRQLKNLDYRILGSKNCENKIKGFIAEWDFGVVNFVEHFAIDKENRGNGIGSRMMLDYLCQIKKPVIIEVEDDESDIGKRRIDFYRRLGFDLSEFGYDQPILRGDKNKVIPLRMMSYPQPLLKEDFLEFKNQVFRNIYQSDKNYC